MPNTYLGLRQVVFRPVICRAQPQSEPGTAWGTASVTTTGLPLGALNTRRAAIRRILGGAANDLLIRLNGIVSGGGAESLYAVQPVREPVPTAAGQVHQPSLMIKCEGCLAIAPKGRRRTSSLECTPPVSYG